ncbi:MAG: alpha/beta fold hydrolase [Chitinophagales bacterium]
MEQINMYNKIAFQKITVEDVSIAHRQIGAGEDLIFIHGFPTHGYTWRKIIPALSEKFKCHILDLPGLGDSDWSDNTDFKTKSQARYIIKLLKKLEINNYSLIAHNSGATVAREIAVNKPDDVEALMLFNTEIPNHRPPWIPFYQRIGLLPLVPNIIRFLLQRKWFIKLPMGFREFYYDKSMLEKESNILPYTSPIIVSKRKTIGAFKYLKGIDWELVDEFKYLHERIKANVLFLWGDKDKTFPINLGKEMAKQFNTDIDFVTIKNTSLLPHEEKPHEVVKAILKFMKK